MFLSLSSGSLKVAIFVLSFVLLILLPEDGAEVAMVPPTLPRLMCRTWQCLGETNGKSSHRKAGIWRIGAGHQSCVQRWSEIHPIHPLPCHVLNSKAFGAVRFASIIFPKPSTKTYKTNKLQELKELRKLGAKSVASYHDMQQLGAQCLDVA